MKTFKLILAIVLCTFLLNCVPTHRVYLKKDNGNHYGWYKNSNNPHNPRHHNGSISLKIKGEPKHHRKQFHKEYNPENNNGNNNGKKKNNKGK